MATSKVYSGRKSAVMVRSSVDVVALTGTGATFPTDGWRKFQVVYNKSDDSVAIASGATGFDELKPGEAAMCSGITIDKTVTPNEVTASTWVIIDTSFGAINEKLDKDGNPTNEYAFDFIVPSSSSFDLTNNTEVAEWIQFGSVYRNKMPTILNWEASSEAKVDFGSSNAQLFLYQSFLNQRRLEVYFYLGIQFESENKLEIDMSKVTVFFGNAYVTDFSVNTAPDDVANLSLSFAGDGELKSVINGQLVVTDWGELLNESVF